MSLIPHVESHDAMVSLGDRVPSRNIPDFCITYIQNCLQRVPRAEDEELEGRMQAFMENDQDLQTEVHRYVTVKAVSKLVVQYMGYDHDRMYLFKSAALILEYQIPRKDPANTIRSHEMRRLLSLHALSHHDFTESLDESHSLKNGFFWNCSKFMTPHATIIYATHLAAQHKLSKEDKDDIFGWIKSKSHFLLEDQKKDIVQLFANLLIYDRDQQGLISIILNIVHDVAWKKGDPLLEIIPIIFSQPEKVDILEYYEASKTPCNPFVLEKMLEGLTQDDINALCDEAKILTNLYKEEGHPIHMVYKILLNFSAPRAE